MHIGLPFSLVLEKIAIQENSTRRESTSLSYQEETIYHILDFISVIQGIKIVLAKQYK